MLTAPRLGSMLMVDIEHLHYGKLTSGAEGRVPSSEGYGVTRRSRGLDPSGDFAVRLPALLDVKRFDADLIDPHANGRGIILVRALPLGPGEKIARVVLVRARLRPEDGEGGHGRLHQQAAIWFVRWDDWRNYPAGILKAAADLQARPDRVDEANRFNADPIRFPFQSLDGERPRQYSSGLKKMLTFLLLAMDRTDAGSITFGVDDFASEADFLETAGVALQNLPGRYPRWAEISIASGLQHDRGGLYIRYLPSARGTSGLEIDEQSLRRRLDRTDPKRPERPSPGIVPPEPSKARVVVALAARSYRPDSAGPTLGIQPSRNDNAELFRRALATYRWQHDAMSALDLLDAAHALIGERPNGAIALRPSQLRPAADLDANDSAALRAIHTAHSQQFSDLRLGALFDLCDLFYWVKDETRYYTAATQLFNKTRERLAAAQVLFPAEEQFVRNSSLLRLPCLNTRTNRVLEISNGLTKWLNAVDANDVPVRDEIQPEILRALDHLGRRLPAVFAQNLDREAPAPTGIHQKYVTTVEAVIGLREYHPAARELLLSLVPRLLGEIERRRG